MAGAGVDGVPLPDFSHFTAEGEWRVGVARRMELTTMVVVVLSARKVQQRMRGGVVGRRPAL